MDAVKREALVNAINVLRDVLDNENLDTDGLEITIEIDDEALGLDEKSISESNGKHTGFQAMEKRVEEDLMDEPPFSDEIVSDMCETCIDMQATSLQRGKPVECVIIGEYTAQYASAISSVFNASGGRVLCIGDCVDLDGTIKPSWKDKAGPDTGKSIFPVKGDTNENYQGMDKLLDMVVLSTCGSYQEMAFLISRWAGLIRKGGILCGTQHDADMYPGSVAAIKDVFGERSMTVGDSGFWYVKPGE